MWGPRPPNYFPREELAVEVFSIHICGFGCGQTSLPQVTASLMRYMPCLSAIFSHHDAPHLVDKPTPLPSLP